MTERDFKAILEFAVKKEEQSHALYMMAQKKVDYQSSRKLLKELAQEELKHKEKLLAILADEKKIPTLGKRTEKIQDLKIVDAMKDTTLTEDADYQRILVFAAKREKLTHDYYASLAKSLEGTEIGTLFDKLAYEELTHKNRLEREYDEYILKEN